MLAIALVAVVVTWLRTAGRAHLNQTPSDPAPRPATAALPGRARGLTRAIAAVLLTVLMAAVVVAPAVATGDGSSEVLALTPPPDNRPVAAPATGVVSPSSSNIVDLSASSTSSPSEVGIPTRIDIPTIGVHASIVQLGLGPGGVIQVPDNFAQAGWYRGGPRPGDAGPAVILGHVDSFRGPAVFFALKDLHAGDTITVTASTGSENFVVDSIAKYSKTEFPTDAVYGPVPDRALRLVTCGGTFDDVHHSYLSNIIVFATAATAGP